MPIQSTLSPGLENNKPLPVRPSHLDYESYWTTSEAPGWLDRIKAQASTWLRELLGKDIDLSADGGHRSSDDSKRMQVLHRKSSRDQGIRLRVWNSNGGRTFIVTVLAVEQPRGGWLQVAVTCDDPRTLASKPRVADMFLDVVEFEDVVALHSKAKYTAGDGVDNLASLINASERRLPVIVAAPLDHESFDAWDRLVAKWTKQVAGIAHVISLSPQAADIFRDKYGNLAVRPGTLRTYPVGVDLSDALTARVSRWLSHQALAGNDRAVARTVESFVRQHSATRPAVLPSTSREWSRAFDRIANNQLREAVTPAQVSLDQRRAHYAEWQRVSPEPSLLKKYSEFDREEDARLQEAAASALDSLALRKELLDTRSQLEAVRMELRRVQNSLMVENLNDDTLQQLVELATRDLPDASAIDTLLEASEAQQSRIDTLEFEIEEERAEKAESRTELARLEEDYDRARREISYLRNRLSENDPEGAFGFIDEGAPANPLGECPATWDLLATSAKLEEHSIIITMPKSKVKSLSSIDTDGAALTAAWDAFGTMAAYRDAVTSSRWASDLHEYCENGPSAAFHVTPNKHSRGESGSTKSDNRYKKARLLPVPSSVNHDGSVHMWAHFKPYSWGSEKKLRIHYYDQVSTDGAIYVGHIGEHLPSASTTKVFR